MKELFEIYEDAKARADKAEKRWELDPRNAKLEEEFDEAYDMEYGAMEVLANAIVRATSGRIEKKTAREMIRTKSEELKVILAA